MCTAKVKLGVIYCLKLSTHVLLMSAKQQFYVFCTAGFAAAVPDGNQLVLSPSANISRTFPVKWLPIPCVIPVLCRLTHDLDIQSLHMNCEASVFNFIRAHMQRQSVWDMPCAQYTVFISGTWLWHVINPITVGQTLLITQSCGSMALQGGTEVLTGGSAPVIVQQ